MHPFATPFAPLSLLAAAALLAACVPVAGPPGYPPGNYVEEWKIVGLGTSTCEQFSATERGSPEREAYRQWLLGYLSAINTGAHSTADVIDRRHLDWTDGAKPWNYMEWLEGYCKPNPGVRFHIAAREVVTREYNEMYKQELRENMRDVR
ncbi:hypothetical protein [Plasticicumulans acidivorans]|uniref:HdeA/HdeB family protein n=1 Tax=Plasticicumulans acidivorans TaxID=886464 RepID=A0A317MVQ6_9GAMM|nr:hypothetical protein [Plasticicumulans acidivorans]PWV62452.1 hypothetical protein C7443_104248 [Plasticicumulans acidivorans]